MSDSKKKIYLGEDLVCQTFTDAEEQAKAFDLFGLEQPVVSSNAPASARPVQQGQVCEFDGTNDFIEIFDNEIVPATFQALSDDIIIEAWIWRDSAGGAPAGWTMSETVCELRQIGVAAGTGIPFSFGIGSGKVGLGVTDDYVTGRQAVFGSTSLSLSTWYHIKVVISGDDYEFFLDGVSDGSGTLTTATGDRSVGASNASLSIGIRAKDSGVRESNHFDGKICGLKISLADGTVVIQQNLNHASGTTAYDSSGNGNDGTLQNGAAFVVDNTLPPEADKLNLEGYTDDSGVLKPRDESDPTKDIDGNPLQYSGSVYPRRPEYRNSYAASFDGVDDYISAAHLTGSETVTSSEGTSTPSISAGRIDFTSGTCSNLILSDGTQYPLAEGAGDTVYDISGNGNHGTINNASTGTEGAGFWAGRIDGEANALNNNNGFSLYENGGNKLRVPYISGAAISSPTVPAGYTLTSENPAITDGYNGAETELDAYNIAEGGNPSPATNNNSDLDAIEFGADFATNDAAFMRLKSSTENDRLITFQDDLTGNDEAVAQNYTQ
jgi:hypothetical protein